MYVEGYVLPVKTDQKEDYIRFARDSAAVFLDHGASRFVESWGDGLEPGERTSFPRAVQLKPDETAVFSWVEYPDKSTRDVCHKKVFADSRMLAMMDNIPVDGKRMIFGGFIPLIDERKDSA